MTPPPRFSIIVCSIDAGRFARFEVSLKKALGEDYELIRIGDARSLAEGYNRGIARAQGEFLVFCHDDIEFLNEGLGRILAEDLARFDIVGAAGTTRLTSGRWVDGGQPHLHGQIAHCLPDRGGIFDLDVFGMGRDPEVVADIQALDGLFFAVRRPALERLAFDESAFDGFHLYDLDFTFGAWLQGRSLAVDYRIHLIHHSAGRYDDGWARYASRFKAKHARHLPLAERPVPLVSKSLPVSSRAALAAEMTRHGKLRRVVLDPVGAPPAGFASLAPLEGEQAGSTSCLEACRALADDSIDYVLASHEALADERIAWLNEIGRVCRRGAVIEIRSAAEEEGGWDEGEFAALAANHPGYFQFGRKDGFTGAFFLKQLRKKAGDAGPQPRVALYQNVKLEQDVAALAAQSTFGRKPEAVAPGRGWQPGKKRKAPRFSIIVPHYQGSISHERFVRGIESLLAQSCQDFEILCYHDGPLLEERDFPLPVHATARHYGDWGHSLRQIGIHEARGRYIVHFNPDNVLYPDALATLAAGKKDILIFPVKMVGLETDGTTMSYAKNGRDESKNRILTGNPPLHGNIDCIQLVMKRSRWLEVGGWFDTREQADGFLYPVLARRFATEFIGQQPLGEHW